MADKEVLKNAVITTTSYKVGIILKSEQAIIINQDIIGYKESYPENVGNIGILTDSYLDIVIPYAPLESDEDKADSVKRFIRDTYGKNGAIKFYKDIFTDITLNRYEISSDGTQAEIPLEHLTGNYAVDKVYKELVSDERADYKPGLIMHICLFNKTDINKVHWFNQNEANEKLFTS